MDESFLEDVLGLWSGGGGEVLPSLESVVTLGAAGFTSSMSSSSVSLSYRARKSVNAWLGYMGLEVVGSEVALGVSVLKNLEVSGRIGSSRGLSGSLVSRKILMYWSMPSMSSSFSFT